MQGLSNSVSQWVFDRGALSGQAGLMAVVVSAEGAHEAWPHAALAEKVAQELHQQLDFPTQAQWAQVIAEKRASFSCLASIERPVNVTPIAGLFLAGDYTACDYPATLEAAVRSGVRSALHVMDARANACHYASGNSN